MPISVVCPECVAEFRVKDELAGKRIRCKQCEAVLTVERAENDPAGDEERDPQPGKRGRKKRGAESLTVFQRFLIFASGNPWVAMGILFFGVWVPISFLLPMPAMVVDVLIILACALGCIVGTVMAFAGVAARNPFQTVTLLAVGGVAALFVPPQHLGKVGYLAGGAMSRAGQDSLYEADTGAGGQIAVYCGIVLVILLAHVVLLSFLWASRLP